MEMLIRLNKYRNVWPASKIGDLLPSQGTIRQWHHWDVKQLIVGSQGFLLEEKRRLKICSNKTNEFPLQSKEDILGESNGQLFSSLDMFWGFGKINQDHRIEYKAAFVRLEGLYHSKSIPLFYKELLAHLYMWCQIYFVVYTEKYSLVYMVDIVILWKTLTKHLFHFVWFLKLNLYRVFEFW